MHFDPTGNVMLQLVGTKKFVLFNKVGTGNGHDVHCSIAGGAG
jgi:hypothetical protein